MMLRRPVSGDLVDGHAVVLDREHGLARIDHAKPKHGVDLHRHAVARDRLLLLDGNGDRARVDLALPLDERNQVVKPRPANAGKPAEAEDHTALVLLRDANAGKQNQRNDDESSEGKDEQVGHTSM